MTVSKGNWFPYAGRESNAGTRVFCFPYAGGGASIFRDWMENRTPDIDICPVQLPGRESRISEPLITEASRLAGMVARAMIPYLDKPFAIFGHSMGALLGFEVARALRDNNCPLPVCLFVSGARAPHLPRVDEPIHTLANDQFWERVCEMNGIPDELRDQDELKSLLLPMIRADFAICESYAYMESAPMPIPILGYGGTHDSSVTVQDLDCWRVHTSSTFRLTMLHGDHFFLRTATHDLLTTLHGDLCDSMNGASSKSESIYTAGLGIA